MKLPSRQTARNWLLQGRNENFHKIFSQDLIKNCGASGIVHKAYICSTTDENSERSHCLLFSRRPFLYRYCRWSHEKLKSFRKGTNKFRASVKGISSASKWINLRKEFILGEVWVSFEFRRLKCWRLKTTVLWNVIHHHSYRVTSLYITFRVRD